MTERADPDCLACRHYFVTWDANLPRGCRAFAIKSRALPARVVRERSGEPCHGFERKEPRRAPAPEEA